jgi:hypothetical protein
VDGVIIAVVRLSLDRFTVKIAAGAAETLMGNGTEEFVPTVTPDGSMICGIGLTTTLRAASGMLGSKLAWISVDAAVTDVAVMGTSMLLVPTANVAVAGTVATAVFSEERLTVSGFGVSAESVRVAVCVVPPLSGNGLGGKLTVAVT